MQCSTGVIDSCADRKKVSSDCKVKCEDFPYDICRVFRDLVPLTSDIPVTVYNHVEVQDNGSALPVCSVHSSLDYQFSTLARDIIRFGFSPLFCADESQRTKEQHCPQIEVMYQDLVSLFKCTWLSKNCHRTRMHTTIRTDQRLEP